jgi:nucleoside-diphosphate-sugar epimerase
VIDCIGLKSVFYGMADNNSSYLNSAKDYYERFSGFFNIDKTTLFFISSGGTVYGKSDGNLISESNNLNGYSPYAIANIEIEKIFASRANSVVIRGSNIFGETKRNRFHQGLITELFFSAIEKREIQIDSLDTVKDYIWIDDFINIIFKLFEINDVSGVFNIGTGTGKSTANLIDLIRKIVQDSGLNIEYGVNNGPRKSSDCILDPAKVLNTIQGFKFTDFNLALQKHWKSILMSRS